MPGSRRRSAAALAGLDRSLAVSNALGQAFTGISLGSILLLAALGLAITYGLMGVINMAHGELIMIGAYATWGVQRVFQQMFPDAFDWYLLAALPVAFAASAAVGALMERSVIRFLYGRPLETLLATWGISLLLMQCGAQPVWRAERGRGEPGLDERQRGAHGQPHACRGTASSSSRLRRWCSAAWRC